VMRDPLNNRAVLTSPALRTSAEAARRLHVGPDRIRQLARAGRLRPAVVTESGLRLFADDELARYERERDANRDAA
jgi:DNA-binding transcriptional MerR regulator